MPNKNKVDHSGKTIGSFKVLEEGASFLKNPEKIEYSQSFEAGWICLCSCGNQRVLRSSTLAKAERDLISGKIFKFSCGCAKRLQEGESAIKRAFYSYRKNAKQRNLQFDLTFEKFKEITSQNCHYCGQIPNNLARTVYNSGERLYNGIDRVENSLGYIKDNMVPCCFKCNYGKLTQTKEEFLEWVKRVYEFSIRHLEQ